MNMDPNMNQSSFDPNANQGQNPGGQANPNDNQQNTYQQQSPPPQPDPFLNELKDCFESLRQVRERLQGLAAKEGVPAELAAALNQFTSRSLSEQMSEALNQAAVGAASNRVSDAVHRQHGPHLGGGFDYKQTFEQFTSEAKKLYRVDQGKMVAGVCAGLAEYFHVDPAVVRIVFIVLAVPFYPVFWISWVLYIVLALVLPVKGA
ncbi:MAG: PspC domain-containing protein [bacterium]|nr:PspC domain-containing protein [bacterium]